MPVFFVFCVTINRLAKFCLDFSRGFQVVLSSAGLLSRMFSNRKLPQRLLARSTNLAQSENAIEALICGAVQMELNGLIQNNAIWPNVSSSACRLHGKHGHWAWKT
jgi:hypothetical protein